MAFKIKGSNSSMFHVSPVLGVVAPGSSLRIDFKMSPTIVKEATIEMKERFQIEYFFKEDSENPAS